jgi:hypothetical protein
MHRRCVVPYQMDGLSWGIQILRAQSPSNHIVGRGGRYPRVIGLYALQ